MAMSSGGSSGPSVKKVLQFMRKKARPYKFEFVEEIQPLRVSVEEEKIYVNRDVLMNSIQTLVEAGLDWKEIMTKNIMHEKAHERYQRWMLKWGVDASEHGWLVSFLIDAVIDRVHFGDDEWYQKWFLAEARHAFQITKRDISDLIPSPNARPTFLYVQAAYWAGVGVIALDEATSLFPEKVECIAQLSKLFGTIKEENDLEWAFPKAMEIYREKCSRDF